MVQLPLRFRSLTPGDAPALREFFRGLSPERLHYRCAGPRDVDGIVDEALTSLDDQHICSLVAEDGQVPRQGGRAIARGHDSRVRMGLPAPVNGPEDPEKSSVY